MLSKPLPVKVIDLTADHDNDLNYSAAFGIGNMCFANCRIYSFRADVDVNFHWVFFHYGDVCRFAVNMPTYNQVRNIPFRMLFH